MPHHAINAHFGVFNRVIAGKCQAVFIGIHDLNGAMFC